MVDALEKRNINQLFIIGSSSTQKVMFDLQEECKSRGLVVSICGIPKTIDNDIPLVDRSFGFNTSVAESIKFIESAEVEATSAENGVGIVRIMGKRCGFLAV